MLIVHGSNGLGKSSLFDARSSGRSPTASTTSATRTASASPAPGSPLARGRARAYRAPPITFSDDNYHRAKPVDRESRPSRNSEATFRNIIALLRAPAWEQRISELQRYLLLTHFLGQSTLSRLTHRNSTERFDILKEAAQSTVIEAVANALHGQGNNTVVRAYARQIEALEREARSLNDLLDQETVLWGEAQHVGAIDEASAATEARRIAVQFLARPNLDGLTRAQARLRASPSPLPSGFRRSPIRSSAAP